MSKKRGRFRWQDGRIIGAVSALTPTKTPAVKSAPVKRMTPVGRINAANRAFWGVK